MLFETHALLTDVFEIHFIELPKLWAFEVDVSCPLTRWLLFLSEDTDQELMEEILMKDKTIHKAYDDLEKLVPEESKLRLYELREKALLDERSNLFAARQKGRAEGREEGRTEGRQEERIQVAKAMLAKGLDEKLILEVANITQKQLNKLKQKLV